MKRFLFLMVEAGGNVPPQMSIARRLAAREHDVHVLADRAVEREAANAGCRFHTFVHAPQHNMRDKQTDVVRDWEPASPAAQIRRIGDHVMFGPSAAYARDLLETIDRVRPDALAVDCLSFGAIIGAEKSGIPAALLVHFPIHAPAVGVTPFGLGLHPARSALGRVRDRVLLAVMRRLFRFGLAPVNAARQELGLAPLREVFDQFHVLPRSLVLTSREYDFVPPGLPDGVRYVGPQLDDPAWPEPWTPPWSADVRVPLVVASLGSTYQRQEGTFGAIVQALGILPVRGFATLGAIDPPASHAPRNVTVVASAPHAALLPLASAVVCHGGHGTVMKALAHGVPVVVMPFGRDQKDNGARVEVADAGLSLSPKASPARIAAAIRRVLEEPGFREGARRMAAIIERDVKEDRAVVEMEALTTRHQSPTPVVVGPSQLGRSARAAV
jgi:MGT family glycosyltransferase